MYVYACIYIMYLSGNSEPERLWWLWEPFNPSVNKYVCVCVYVYIYVYVSGR